MTLRDIFQSIGIFFEKLWNGLLDANILLLLGIPFMTVYPPYLIYQLSKSKKVGAIILVVFMFLIWIYFLKIVIGMI